MGTELAQAFRQISDFWDEFLIQISYEVDPIRIIWLRLPSRSDKSRFMWQGRPWGEKTSASGTMMSLSSKMFFILLHKSLLLLFCYMNPQRKHFPCVVAVLSWSHHQPKPKEGPDCWGKHRRCVARLKLIGLNKESKNKLYFDPFLRIIHHKKFLPFLKNVHKFGSSHLVRREKKLLLQYHFCRSNKTVKSWGRFRK